MSISLPSSLGGVTLGLSALRSATQSLGKIFEHLSTGKRVNRASDDPAGVAAIAEFAARQQDLNAQLKDLDQEDASLGAREGGASVVADLVVSLQGYVVAAANSSGLSDEEKQANQDQVDSILQSIDRLSDTTTFKGEQVIRDINTTTLGSRDIGHDSGDGSIAYTTYSLHDLASGGALNLLSGDMDAAQKIVSSAVQGLSDQRAGVGTRMRDIDSQRRTATNELTEITGARSQIEDTDYAQESANLVRAQGLQQSAMFVTMFAANQKAKITLQLLSAVTA